MFSAIVATIKPFNLVLREKTSKLITITSTPRISAQIPSGNQPQKSEIIYLINTVAAYFLMIAPMYIPMASAKNAMAKVS